MVDTPSSDTPTHLSFLWGDRKGVCSKHQLFSNWQTGEETLSHPPLHLPLLPSLPPLSSRYAFTSLTPTFSSQSPSLVGRSFQPPVQQKKQRRQGHFPSFPPCREKKKWRTRPADHPFQRWKDRAQQKASASSILTPTHANSILAFSSIFVEYAQECAGADSNRKCKSNTIRSLFILSTAKLFTHSGSVFQKLWQAQSSPKWIINVCEYACVWCVQAFLKLWGLVGVLDLGSEDVFVGWGYIGSSSHVAIFQRGAVSRCPTVLFHYRNLTTCNATCTNCLGFCFCFHCSPPALRMSLWNWIWAVLWRWY